MGNFLYTLIIYPLELIIEFVFMLFQEVFDIEGLSVIGVSLAVSFFCLPLYIVAERWQEVERRQQEKMSGQIKRIKKTFSGDERYMITTTYYKQCHYSPIMALRSSFGLLIQIPFFIAAYSFLSNVPILQGRSFLFIRDMGKPDALFTIGSFPINVLPIAMTIINIVAGAIYSKGHMIREKVQIYVMALIFLVLLYNSPSGLVIYWTMNNLFSLVKNVFYKIKNPLKVLYFIICAAVIVTDIYLIGEYHISWRKRLVVIIIITAFFLAPLIIKMVRQLLDTILQPIVTNSRLRFGIFLFSFVSICLLCGLAIPTNTIGSSVQEFADIDGYGSPLYFIFNTLLQSIGLFIFWPMCVYFLFHGRVQTLMACTGLILLVCGLMNAFAFPGDYGTLNRLLTFSTVIDSRAKNTFILINTLALAASITVIMLLLKFRQSKTLYSLIIITTLALSVNGIINIVKISSEYNDYEKNIAANVKESNMTPVLHLSKTGKNVIVIMMDRLRNSFINPIFKTYPEFNNIYDGFKVYKNTFGFGGNTILAAASLWGGYEYTPGAMNKRNTEKQVDKQNQALLLLPRIFTEQQEDWTAVLADPPWANYSWISDLSITNPYPKITGANLERKYSAQWTTEHKNLIEQNKTSKVLKRNLLYLSFFESFPACLRDALYDEGFYFSSSIVPDDVDEFVNCYSVIDYMPRLTDFTNNAGTYTSITNNLTHCKILLNEPDFLPSLNKDERNLGTCPISSAHCFSTTMSFYIAFARYIQFLKDNNCYDNTRIILVADHGWSDEVPSDVEDWYSSDKIEKGFMPIESYHPMLMIKDFNSHGKIQYDYDTFMSNADVPTLALKDIIGNPVNPYTGKKIEPPEDKCQDGITTTGLQTPNEHGKYTYTTDPDKWLYVHDSIYNSKNWSKFQVK